jgi:hypothetical protein
MFDKDGKTNDKFKTRAEAKDEDRDIQLSRMLEKCAHVKSFLVDKKEELRKKFAAQQI